MKGIPEDEFESGPLVEGKAPTHYKRREWRAADGEAYYSWDGDDLPNWFSVPKTAWSESRRKGLVNENPPEHIYHYTSVDGFFGVVQSRNLWLSDYSYLNDKRELLHGLDLLAEVAERMLASESRDPAKELLQAWIQNLPRPNHRVCIASFSALGDSLSQWRAYGPIAIGFSTFELPRHAYRAILRSVEYRREEQRALAELYLHHMRESFLVDSECGRLTRIEDVYGKTDRLIELVSFFKDPAFESEKEYRLTYIEYPGLMESFGQRTAPKRFRVARGRILPYVLSNELAPKLPDFDPPLPIREVVLGPEADDVLERGVREFLAEQGLTEVAIVRSRVPYRT